jgi:hypothetical protein
MTIWRLFLGGFLVFAVSLPVLIQAQQGTQPGMKVTGLVFEFEEVLTAQKVKGLLVRATESGYQVTVQEQPCDLSKWPKGCPTKVVAVNLVKTGMTEKGRGLLNIKWDEREAWNILFFQQADNLRLVKSEGIREEKAPIAGTWRVTEKLAGLPAPLRSGSNQ